MTTLERRILDALPFTIYAVDLDGRVTSTNRSSTAGAGGAVPVMDHAPGNVPIWDALAGLASRTALEAAMESLRRGGIDHVRWECPAGSPDDERVFVIEVAAMRQRQATTGFVIAAVDITSSHRSRAALIDTGLVLSRTLDLTRIYHEVARQARNATQCDGIAIVVAAEDTGQLTVAFQSGFDDTVDRLEARLAPLSTASIAGGTIVTTDDADRTWIVAPLVGADRAVGAIALAGAPPDWPRDRDASARALATLAAQAAAAIERARRVRHVEHKRRIATIGEVAAGVAQELRNPLFGISSAAQLLRFRTGEDPVVEKNVGRILREVERLNRMVTSLLEYGRPAPLDVAPHDPDAVWDDVLDSLRGRVESKGLVLDRARAEPAATCAVDAGQLSHMFSNLLINACDAAPTGGTLALAAGRTPTGGWRSTLHNGGSVIAPDVLPRIFDLFFSTKAGGTGIGLALCQRIVDAHQGTIAVDSGPERGTTVTVTLPAAV